MWVVSGTLCVISLDDLCAWRQNDVCPRSCERVRGAVAYLAAQSHLVKVPTPPTRIPAKRRLLLKRSTMPRTIQAAPLDRP